MSLKKKTKTKNLFGWFVSLHRVGNSITSFYQVSLHRVNIIVVIVVITILNIMVVIDISIVIITILNMNIITIVTSSLVSWLKLYSCPTITFSRLISTQLSLRGMRLIFVLTLLMLSLFKVVVTYPAVCAHAKSQRRVQAREQRSQTCHNSFQLRSPGNGKI